MKQNVIIFGNGIGMAINNTSFGLAEGLKHGWNKLKDYEQQLLEYCLSIKSCNIPPTSEKDLDIAYLTATSTRLLRSIEEDNQSPNTWLANGNKQRDFHFILRRYSSFVAEYFFDKMQSYVFTPQAPLVDAFLERLVRHIKSSRDHVATLNYDTALYEKFVDNGICKNTSYLIDGMVDSGFDVSNVRDIKQRNKCGYYFHLHGSIYLFENDSPGNPIKRNRAQLGSVSTLDYESLTKTIVLAAIEHKPLIIEESNLLKGYWSLLREEMYSAEKLTLFGYSGGDDHLNELINEVSRLSQIEINIIQWCNSPKQKADWDKVFPSKSFNLIHFNNILEFSNWMDPKSDSNGKLQ